jgi:hypothetical protein
MCEAGPYGDERSGGVVADGGNEKGAHQVNLVLGHGAFGIGAVIDGSPVSGRRTFTSNWGGRLVSYVVVRLLPPCQSSWIPTWSVSTPKLRSWAFEIRKNRGVFGEVMAKAHDVLLRRLPEC